MCGRRGVRGRTRAFRGSTSARSRGLPLEQLSARPAQASTRKPASRAIHHPSCFVVCTSAVAGVTKGVTFKGPKHLIHTAPSARRANAGREQHARRAHGGESTHLSPAHTTRQKSSLNPLRTPPRHYLSSLFSRCTIRVRIHRHRRASTSFSTRARAGAPTRPPSSPSRRSSRRRTSRSSGWRRRSAGRTRRRTT